MYTGPNNLADLGEYTITEEDYRPKPKQRIQLQDWIMTNECFIGDLDHKNKTIDVYADKPTDVDVYYEVWGQPWEIIWLQK